MLSISLRKMKLQNFVLFSLVLSLICVLFLLSQSYVRILKNSMPRGSQRQKSPLLNHGLKFMDCSMEFPPTNLPPFTFEELKRIDQCEKTEYKQRKWSERHFRTGIDENAHTYLRPNSTVIELGGNIGVFAKNMLRKYRLEKYIVLEPLQRYFTNISAELTKFPSNVRVLNFGLGSSDRSIEIRDMNDGTSAFINPNDPKISERPLSTLKIVNALDFFASLGIGCAQVDLLSMNCEGCEIEVLEMLIETSMIKYFKHIQFQLHTSLKHLNNITRRYCQIRERLPLTHKVHYSYPFIWEGWQIKDE